MSSELDPVEVAKKVRLYSGRVKSGPWVFSEFDGGFTFIRNGREVTLSQEQLLTAVGMKSILLNIGGKSCVFFTEILKA